MVMVMDLDMRDGMQRNAPPLTLKSMSLEVSFELDWIGSRQGQVSANNECIISLSFLTRV